MSDQIIIASSFQLALHVKILDEVVLRIGAMTFLQTTNAEPRTTSSTLGSRAAATTTGGRGWPASETTRPPETGVTFAARRLLTIVTFSRRHTAQSQS